MNKIVFLAADVCCCCAIAAAAATVSTFESFSEDYVLACGGNFPRIREWRTSVEACLHAFYEYVGI